MIWLGVAFSLTFRYTRSRASCGVAVCSSFYWSMHSQWLTGSAIVCELFFVFKRRNKYDFET
jgi:hypothetical protein